MRMDQTTQKSRNDTEAGESLHHEEVASTRYAVRPNSMMRKTARTAWMMVIIPIAMMNTMPMSYDEICWVKIKDLSD